MNIGDTVMFVDKLFEPPHTPYYNEYKGHRFTVVKFHWEKPEKPTRDPHAELECLSDPTIKVKRYVRWDELRIMEPFRPR